MPDRIDRVHGQPVDLTRECVLARQQRSQPDLHVCVRHTCARKHTHIPCIITMDTHTHTYTTRAPTCTDAHTQTHRQLVLLLFALLRAVTELFWPGFFPTSKRHRI
jgi:hypothetical protein